MKVTYLAAVIAAIGLAGCQPGTSGVEGRAYEERGSDRPRGFPGGVGDLPQRSPPSDPVQPRGGEGEPGDDDFARSRPSRDEALGRDEIERPGARTQPQDGTSGDAP